MQIELSVEDIDKVNSILRFASNYDNGLSYVCAVASEDKLSWIATDNGCLAIAECGTTDKLTGSVALPKHLFVTAARIARTRDDVSFKIRLIDSGSALLLVSGLTIPFQSRPKEVLNLVEVARTFENPDTQMRVRRDDMAAVVDAAISRPPWVENDHLRRFVLRTSQRQSTLEATAEWVGHPDTHAVVSCETSVDAALALDPSRILDAIAGVRDSHVLVSWSPGGNSPVWITCDSGPAVLIMPVKSPLDILRPNFEQVLAEVLNVEVKDLVRDKDDDYPLGLRDGALSYVRLEPGDEVRRVQSRIRLFLMLAHDIEETSGALTEINLQNQRRPFVRLYLREETLFLESDMTLDGVSKPNLQAAIEAFDDAAREIIPWMQAFFGKPAPPGAGDPGE